MVLGNLTAEKRTGPNLHRELFSFLGSGGHRELCLVLPTSPSPVLWESGGGGDDTVDHLISLSQPSRPRSCGKGGQSLIPLSSPASSATALQLLCLPSFYPVCRFE